MDFFLNHDVDQPLTQAGEAFLPLELQAQLARLSYVNDRGDRVPYVQRTIEFNRGHRNLTPEAPPRYGVGLFVTGLLMGVLPLLCLLARRRMPRFGRIAFGAVVSLYGLLVGFLGVIMLFLWFGTNHMMAHHNENLFLASPLALLAVPWGLQVARGKEGKAAARLAVLWPALLGMGLLGGVLKLLPAFDQRNGHYFSLWLPVLTGMALSAVLGLKGMNAFRHSRAIGSTPGAAGRASGASLTSSASGPASP
jgi:hypothetical protein